MRSGIHVDMVNGLQLLRFSVSAVIAILKSDGLGHHSGLPSINTKLLFTSQQEEANWNIMLLRLLRHIPQTKVEKMIIVGVQIYCGPG